MKRYVIQHTTEMTDQFTLVDRKENTIGFVKRSDVDAYEEATAYRYSSADGSIQATIGVMKDSLHSLWATTYIFDYQGVRYLFEDSTQEQSFQFRMEGMIDEHHISAEINWEDELEIERDENLAANVRVSRNKERTIFHFSSSVKENSALFAFSILVPFMYVLHQKERNIDESMLNEDYLS